MTKLLIFTYMQLLSLLLILSNLYLVWRCSRMVCISQMITVCGDKWGRYFYTTGCCFCCLTDNVSTERIITFGQVNLSGYQTNVLGFLSLLWMFLHSTLPMYTMLVVFPQYLQLSVAVLALRSGRISQLADICNFWWWKPSDDDMDFLSLGRNCQIPLAICRSCRHLTPTRTAFTALLARSVWFCSGSRNCASAALLY